uniref:Uncharacterized protein n=1 Tax=Arundo donax TaxID=35708 RepID=A0A0A8YZL0_ARUDO
MLLYERTSIASLSQTVLQKNHKQHTNIRQRDC